MTTLAQLSAKLGFDTEAMVKPKTHRDIISLLNEALSEVQKLNDMIDTAQGHHSREEFYSGNDKFTQYMDADDNAHILQLDESLKVKIIDGDRTIGSPWVKIFTIDGSYCNFKNSNNAIVGRVTLFSSSPFKWRFVSVKMNNEIYSLDCKNNSPYDCEREVVSWLSSNNLLQQFKDFK